MNWKIKGMNQDTSASSFSPEFAFENRNIRLATNDGNTMMSWVNEKGTRKLTFQIDTTPWVAENKTYVYEIQGYPIGTAVIHHKLVLFVKGYDLEADDDEYGDSIIVLEYSGGQYDLAGKRLFKGNLNFDIDYPLETLVSYESENIQKVYWTDNRNQPRFINVAPYMDKKAQSYTNNSFNFIQDLGLEEKVYVTKEYGTGEFPAGVIQYAFTYYNKYGQESCIFNTTKLYSISHKARGGKPGEKIANAFNIHISELDPSFDYVRIYSILRTSKDATPVVKRVQDIEIPVFNSSNLYYKNSIDYCDTGYSGDVIDPTELLYKGGEDITVGTMEQKDNTLFLGNITTTKTHLSKTLREQVHNAFFNDNDDASITCIYNVLSIFGSKISLVAEKPYYRYNTIDESGFKYGEYYRIGIQFQYKTGKWSAPIWLKDIQIDKKSGPSSYYWQLLITQIQVTLNNTSLLSSLYSSGYRRARLMMAQPSVADRTVLCQGIANPTLYQLANRYSINSTTGIDYSSKNEGALYAQSSWLFRPKQSQDFLVIGKAKVASDAGGFIVSSGSLLNWSNIDCQQTTNPANSAVTSIEIGTDPGDVNYNHMIDDSFITIHSPEIELDETLYNTDFSGATINCIGAVTFVSTYGDIDIQTSTPTIGSAAGFIHKAIKTDGDAALISGLFYEDLIVDDLDSNGNFGKYGRMVTSVRWPVCMWQRNGSLNNDCSRDNRSSALLKKKISNYHVGNNGTLASTSTSITTNDIQLFNSDELSIIKVNGCTYMGNIDSMVTPKYPCYKPFAGSPWRSLSADPPNFLSKCEYKVGMDGTTGRLWQWSSSSNSWVHTGTTPWGDGYSGDIGDYYTDLAETMEPVRIKYKSSPHLVASLKDGYTEMFYKMEARCLPLVEVVKNYNKDVLYGGQSNDALLANTWIPISAPTEFTSSSLTITSDRGDTWFQRYECLKTYAYTPEDINQVIDIAAFTCESHVNIEGRYDRNREQVSNLNMSPTNFNLINPVYSQLDNFFNYKMLDESYYDNDIFTNQITWTKTKENGADIDLWTNITLANTLEADGDKGKITKLTRFNNQLICFQDSGISQILYNENTQITSTEGVPIEIANSSKVQGKRYLSDTVGCSNKWSIAQTPSGIYFIDTNEKSIYLFNGQLTNISTAGGFNSWAKQHIKPSNTISRTTGDNFVTYYDRLNQEVLFNSSSDVLAYSEKFNCFTSFYNYGSRGLYFTCLDDKEYWIDYHSNIWQHQDGEYCNFFGANYPFSTTLLCNQEPQVSKTLTNLEFRACVEGEGTYDSTKDKFAPSLPFDSLEVWDEYQHGLHNLSLRDSSKSTAQHSTLTRKFRMWRCDIPRDNAPVSTDEAEMGITRFKARPLDRIQNPWAYVKLKKAAASSGSFLSKTEVHDIMATYFA